MKIAVIGSRNFNDYDLLKEELNKYFITQIISGGAKGADALAERYAKEFNIETQIFKPDWKLGRHAGLLRNTKIIETSDFVVAFWDGESRGTQNSIKTAEKNGKPINIIEYNKIQTEW